MTETATKPNPREVARAMLARWRADPVLFAIEALGVQTWGRQQELMRAIATHDQVAVVSGHKTGKTTALAIMALWFVLLHERARVVLTSSSARQVDSQVWKEIRRIYQGAPIAIGGTLHKTAEHGLELDGEREIKGFATSDTEKMAGFSGPEMMFICDEASGIEDPIFEAITGNTIGGAKVVMAGNPTKAYGFFYEAFNASKADWHGIKISSLECALEWPKFIKVAPGKKSGLATVKWIEKKKALWGEEDPRYKIRVLGDFVDGEDSLMISKDLARAAQERWAKIKGEGPLFIGVDVARFGSDCSAIAPRRGRKIAYVKQLRKVDGPKVLEEVRKIAKALRRPGEKPTVVLDVTGIGQGAAGFYRECDEEFDLIEVDNSTSADSEEYARKRDEVWATFQTWCKAGGALPKSEKLLEDITAPRYELDEKNRLCVESKKKLRKRLKRSTDLGDAAALSCFEKGKRVFEDLILDGVNSPARM